MSGTGAAFEGQIGQVILLDHLYAKLGQASATGAIGMGQTTFSTLLYFQSSFPAGIQEGVLVLSALSNANGSITGEAMEKVLINGALESAFAVLSVDVSVSPNSIAGNACGTTMTFTYTATFHVQVGVSPSRPDLRARSPLPTPRRDEWGLPMPFQALPRWT